MSNTRGRGAWKDVAIGVTWRAAIFLIAALAFRGMLGLRKWESYAASNAWADRVKNVKGEWMGAIADAATAIVADPARSAGPREKDVLYRDINARIRNGNFGGEPAENYRAALKARAALQDNLKRATAPLAARYNRESLAGTTLQTRLDDVKDDLAELTSSTLPDPKAQRYRKVVIAALKKEQTNLVARRGDVRETMKQLEADRGAIEMAFQKRIAELDTAIKGAETDMRADFDATAAYARMIDFGLVRYIDRDRALSIGNPDDPLHILHDVAWYGFQAAIVLIMCIILVPWLLKVSGDSADPNATKSAVTQKVRDMLARVFTRVGVTAPAAARIAAAAIVATASAFGVNAAADHTPEQPKIVQTEGAQGKDGKDGKAGADAKLPKELLDQIADQAKALDEQRKALETQAQTITSLTTSIGDVNKVVIQTGNVIANLTKNSGTMTTHVDRVLNEVGTLNQTMARLNESVGSVATLQAAFIHDSLEYNRQSLVSLNTLIQAAQATHQKIDGIGTNVETMVTVMPNVQDAFLQASMLEDDGVFDRVSRSYQLTPVGIDIVRKMLAKPNEGAGKEVLAALDTVMKAQTERYSRKKLSDDLHVAARSNENEAVKKLLDLLMPTILKVSRIPRRSL